MWTCQWGCGGQKGGIVGDGRMGAGFLPVNWGVEDRKWGIVGEGRMGVGFLPVNGGVEDRKGGIVGYDRGGVVTCHWRSGRQKGRRSCYLSMRDGKGRLGAGCYLSMGVGKAGWGWDVTCQLFLLEHILCIIILSPISGFIKSLILGRDGEGRMAAGLLPVNGGGGG